jgi:hypothetical protein
MLVKKLSIAMFDAVVLENGNVRFRLNTLQNSANTTVVTLKNDTLIYVSKATTNNLGRYTLINKDSEKSLTGEYLPYFTLRYDANEMSTPPFCLRNRISAKAV